MEVSGQQMEVTQGESMTEYGAQEETTWGGGKKTSQYGGTLHNSLTVLIYHLADLAPSQHTAAFVIFELKPRTRGEKERWRGQINTTDRKDRENKRGKKVEVDSRKFGDAAKVTEIKKKEHREREAAARGMKRDGGKQSAPESA